MALIFLVTCGLSNPATSLGLGKTFRRRHLLFSFHFSLCWLSIDLDLLAYPSDYYFLTTCNSWFAFRVSGSWIMYVPSLTLSLGMALF